MNVMPRLQASRRSGALLSAAAAVALLAACHSLEVTNPNSPDLARLTASDVQDLLRGAYSKWYHSLADVAPAATADVMSDHYETAWNSWFMMRADWEPRIYPLTNSTTDALDDARGVIEIPWYNNYGAVASANLVILALKNGVNFPGPMDSSSNPMILAAARFIQGAALSNVALVFDSGYALDETTDPTELALVGRDSVRRAALAKLDVAISLASGATSPWSIPESFLNQIGEAWTNTQLAQVANYWAARTIAYFPHNMAENDAADWPKVLAYASKGISAGAPFDVEVLGDGGVKWWNDHTAIGDAVFTWTRIDYRVICLLDPTYKCHKANGNSQDSIPGSVDYRFNGDDVVGDNCVPPAIAQAIAARDPSLASYGPHCSTADKLGGADFVYLPLRGATWPGFPTARGYYRFSPVGHIRYYDVGWDSPNYAVGRLRFVLAAENDLLWAEALVRTGGSFASAAALINKTRVGRGHLPALAGTETRAQLLDAITYERGIELFAAGPMVPWFDQRRMGALTNPHYYTAANDSDQTGWLPYGKGLQPGTPRLLPVPARELTLLGDPVYTYGGLLCGIPGSLCPNLNPGAPLAGSAAPVHAGGSIFGTAPDGRVITGPGRWATIADSIIGVRKRAHRSRPT